MKVSHHIILLSVVCFIGLMQSTNIYAQETTTREERIKQLQLLQSKYDQEELSQIPSASKNTPANLEKLELPPLSVFLDAVSENATIKKLKSNKLKQNTDYKNVTGGIIFVLMPCTLTEDIICSVIIVMNSPRCIKQQ